MESHIEARPQFAQKSIPPPPATRPPPTWRLADAVASTYCFPPLDPSALARDNMFRRRRGVGRQRVGPPVRGLTLSAAHGAACGARARAVRRGVRAAWLRFWPCNYGVYGELRHALYRAIVR